MSNFLYKDEDGKEKFKTYYYSQLFLIEAYSEDTCDDEDDDEEYISFQLYVTADSNYVEKYVVPELFGKYKDLYKITVTQLPVNELFSDDVTINNIYYAK